MIRVAVVGATGFVGRAVVERLRQCGADVRAVRAPRLTAETRTSEDVVAALNRRLTERTRADIDDVDVVVNAAGVTPSRGASAAELFGANALLPALLVAATTAQRLVHVSSAAVQGRAPVLTARGPLCPFNAYSASKALGEQVALRLAPERVAVLRPASVHGPGRSVTRRVVRLAGSPAAVTLAPGSGPTPQAHVANVAAAAAHLVMTTSTPPSVVLQPSEGFSTAGFLALMGGRPPRLIPSRLRPAVAAAVAVGSRLPRAAQQVRRLELLLLGQDQEESWLVADGYMPVADRLAWEAMAEQVRAAQTGAFA